MEQRRGVTLKLGLLLVGVGWWLLVGERTEIEMAANIIAFGVGKLIVIYVIADCLVAALFALWRPSTSTKAETHG